jgi:hypothetical protein
MRPVTNGAVTWVSREQRERGRRWLLEAEGGLRCTPIFAADARSAPRELFWKNGRSPCICCIDPRVRARGTRFAHFANPHSRRNDITLRKAARRSRYPGALWKCKTLCALSARQPEPSTSSWNLTSSESNPLVCLPQKGVAAENRQPLPPVAQQQPTNFIRADVDDGTRSTGTYSKFLCGLGSNAYSNAAHCPAEWAAKGRKGSRVPCESKA